jgi:hypothetical protein
LIIHFDSSEKILLSSYRVSGKRNRRTPGITRPPEPLPKDEMVRVTGRVHAVVMRAD